MSTENICPLAMDGPAKWTLCCRGSGRKCPSILVQQDWLHIRDDDGHVVVMSLDQFDDVTTALFETLRFRTKVTGG
jgi:hypothetical protein